MPGMSGLGLLRCLLALVPDCPVVLITAYPERARDAVARGAVCVLEKPVEVERLQMILEQIFEADGGQ